jgi:DNA-binding MarR family transcriptional regulator
MSTKNIPELALEFGRSMAEMKNYLRQHIQGKIREHNLNITFELLEIMSLLRRKDGVNQQELADIAVKDMSTMTYLIDNLVKLNLVTRVERDIDRRNKLIFLTEEGKLLQKKLPSLAIEMYDKATAEVNTGKIEKAILLVKRMNENLKTK